MNDGDTLQPSTHGNLCLRYGNKVSPGVDKINRK